MQRHDCEIVFLLDAGGRQWRLVGECPLLDMELLQGRRLALGKRYTIELQGHAVVLYEWGLLVSVAMPGRGGLSELQHALWAFPDWLEHLGKTGVQRSDVVGATGLQALEWHARYLEWAAAKECRHLEYLIGQGKSLEALEAWHPTLRANPLAARLLDDLEQQGRIPKRGKGRPGDVDPAIRELAALAYDIHRHEVPGVRESLLAACWEACRLRPEWVPVAWQVKAGTRDETGNKSGPGMSLYRAINRPHIADRPLADRLRLPAPAHWEGCRPPVRRGRTSR